MTMKTTALSRLLPALGAALTLSAGASQAGTVSFDLTQGSNGNYSTYTVNAAGHSVATTAWVSESGAAYSSAQVVKSGSGLGVLSFGVGNATMVDNAGNHAEALLFDFGNTAFTKMSVVFTQLSSSEKVNLWWGDSLNLANVGAPLLSFVSNSGTSPYTLGNFGAARYLLIAAANNGNTNGNCGAANDCFRVSALTGEVPEPGALALVALAGVLGVAASRRRRAQPQG